MATATRHTTMQQEIAAARDEHRSGALDVECGHAHASLFFVFGQPGHAVFESSDGRALAGQAALTALIEELPADYRIAPWRRIMVTEDSLRCTADELIALFVATPGDGGVASAADTAAAPPAAEAPPPPPQAPLNSVPFNVDDVPLLPSGRLLWTDDAANVTHLAAVAPQMPNSLITLGGATARAVVVIAGGAILDAVLVDGSRGLRGDDAVDALAEADEGVVSAYRVDDARLLGALTMLWRLPRLPVPLPAAWLKAEKLAGEVHESGRSCALIVDSADPGVALFVEGQLAAVYTTSRRRAVSTMTAFRALLKPPDAQVTVVGFGIVIAEPVAPVATSDEPIRLFAARDDSIVIVNGTGDHEDAATGMTTTKAASGVSEATVEDAPAGVEPDTEIEPAPEHEAEAKADTEFQPEAETEDEAPVLTVVEDEPDDVPTFGLPEGEPVHTFVVPSANGGWHPVELPSATADEVAVGEVAVDEVTVDDADDAEEQPRWTPYTVAAESEGSHAPFEPVVFGTLETVPPPPPVSPDIFAGQAQEFVPARLDLDVAALRKELNDIAAVWLGADDTADVAAVIAEIRPGVDDFVAAIAVIGAMEVPGHDQAVVRAMAREMHFRAAEVLCGV